MEAAAADAVYVFFSAEAVEEELEEEEDFEEELEEDLEEELEEDFEEELEEVVVLYIVSKDAISPLDHLTE